MKKFVFILFFFLPMQLFSQVKCMVEGVNYPVSGVKIHTERTFSDNRIRKESYMETSGDSIIYHEITWATEDTLTSTASHYRRVSFSKKDAKKNKSFELNEFKNSKVCLVTVVFKKNVLVHRSHFQGEKTSYLNKEKTFFEPLFDSTEEAQQFLDEYFKKE